MANLKRLLGSAIIVCLALQACQETPAEPVVPQVENKALLSNKALNTAIENYTDKYLSEIIRIRNYNRERVNKVVCVHHTFYVENAVIAPAAINAYVKLLCAEGTLPTSTEPSLTNLTSLPSKLSLQKYPNQERFKVITDDTPRDAPFYSKDLRRILSDELMDRMNASRSDTQSDEAAIRRKAVEYSKSRRAGCDK